MKVELDKIRLGFSEEMKAQNKDKDIYRRVCKTHNGYLVEFVDEECPWCQIEQLKNRIEKSKTLFEVLCKTHDKYMTSGGCTYYMSDMSHVVNSFIREQKALEKEEH